jgi:hypothetical protein
MKKGYKSVENIKSLSDKTGVSFDPNDNSNE